MLKCGSRLARWLLTLVLLGATSGPVPAATAEQKVALVIGNSAYPSAPLRNPVNDASAMAKKLGTRNFARVKAGFLQSLTKWQGKF